MVWDVGVSMDRLWAAVLRSMFEIDLFSFRRGYFERLAAEGGLGGGGKLSPLSYATD